MDHPCSTPEKSISKDLPIKKAFVTIGGGDEESVKYMYVSAPICAGAGDRESVKIKNAIPHGEKPAVVIPPQDAPAPPDHLDH